MLIHDTFSSHNLCEISEKIALNLKSSVFILQCSLKILDFQNSLMALYRFRQLTKKIINYLFLFLSTIFALLELIVIDNTCYDLFFLDVEIILSLFKSLPEELAMLKSPLLNSFALLSSLFPSINFLSKFLVFLLDEFRVECTGKIFLFFEPFIENSINNSKIQSQITDFKLGLCK